MYIFLKENYLWSKALYLNTEIACKVVLYNFLMI